MLMLLARSLIIVLCPLCLGDDAIEKCDTPLTVAVKPFGSSHCDLYVVLCKSFLTRVFLSKLSVSKSTFLSSLSCILSWSLNALNL